MPSDMEIEADRFYGITVGENGYVLTAPGARVLVFTRASQLAAWLEEHAVREGEMTPPVTIENAPSVNTLAIPAAPSPDPIAALEATGSKALFAPDVPQTRVQSDTLEIAAAGFIEDLSFIAPELRTDRLSDRLVDLCEDFQLEPKRIEEQGGKFVEWLLTLEGDLSTQGDAVHRKLRALFVVDPAPDGP